MRIQIPTIGAAVIVTVLCMGLLGLLVVFPIACIQLTWNSLNNLLNFLPLINVWQASLLYLAGATLVYLTGLVRIEFDPDYLD
jgi:hypothetical protein